MLSRKRLEISDEDLQYLAQHLRQQLSGGDPEQIRAVVQNTLVRINLREKEIEQH